MTACRAGRMAQLKKIRAVATARRLVRSWPAGQLRTNRLAVATALIFFSCAIRPALHAVMYWRASYAMPGMTEGWSLWPSAVWDAFTGAVGLYYWSLRRGYGVLLG